MNNSIKEFHDPKFINKINEFQSIDLKKNDDIKKILIIKWGGMGDVILATGIMEDISKAFPKAIIHLNTLPQWQKLFINDKRFSKIWGFINLKKIGSFKHCFRWIKKLKFEKYDFIIDLQTNDRSRLYLFIYSLLYKKPNYLIGNHAVFPYSLFPQSRKNIIHPFQILQRTINTFGVESKTIFPKIFLAQKDKTKVKLLLKKNNLIKTKFVIFICGSNSKGKVKRWGRENFYALSTLIKNNLSLKVILIGGPDDIEECKAISSMDKDIINLCNKTELTELPILFKKAEFIIGNDTGTSHLAASTKTPMIVLFGPTDPLRSKPIGKQILGIKSLSKKISDISPGQIFLLIKKLL